MKLSRWQIFLARLLFLAYVLFTASYCLLAYVPFTYQQVHVGELLPWLTRLVGLHYLLYWVALAVALITILPDLKGGPSRHLARGLAGAGVLAGIALLFHPLLTSLTNDSSSLRWCLLSLIPLLWLAAIDWIHDHTTLTMSHALEDGSTHAFFAAWQAAVYLAALNFVIAFFRVWNGRGLHFSPSQWSQTLGWSLVSHLMVFLLIFVVLDLAATAATLLPEGWKGRGTFIGSALVVVAFMALVMRYIIFPPLSFTGATASLAATVLSVSLVIYATGISVRLRDPEASVGDHVLDLQLMPFRFLGKASWLSQVIALTVVGAAAWILAARLGRLDWEFLLQKMAAIFVWTVAFAVFYTIAPRVKPVSRTLAYAVASVVLLCYLGLTGMQARTAEENGPATPTGKMLDQYADYDVSFRLVDDMLRPREGVRSSGAGDTFFAFLAENTNIPRSTRLSPANISLVNRLGQSPERKPHIFFLVVDSLRRDYLSPYNPAVKFTPSIDALANDSVVFENAFTHYGGTGLSEPSIWVGGLMVHKQYITPFAPMNSLQKLVEADGYREWISRDTILEQVVPASANSQDLDEHVGTMYYDLCKTLEEVAGRLVSLRSSADPAFVYTQAQNIHVSVIDREGRSVPPGASFPPEFNAAYASRVQRMDTCLGKFFDDLKKSGAYDDSIIIVTSDHGDSLGERGRWGHAYTIFPEIVRIPLIVRLPSWMRGELKYDTQAAAFLTDLTPTLYYLLSEKPIVNNPILGRPLFTASLEEQALYRRDSYLVASSYAPVYGLLSQNGHRLYIADGVNYRDYAYELRPDGSSRDVPLSEDQRAAAQQEVRRQIDEIARFYGLR